jgi:GT2 family glycosyltransferase
MRPTSAACSRSSTPCRGALSFYFRRDSHIDRARGDCVAHFLSTEATHLFFIDADIGFTPERLRAPADGQADIVGGVYPIKRDDGGFPIDLEAMGATDAEGFAACNELPGGFLCIKREVFDKVDPVDAFDSFRVDGRLITEDYAFCARARRRASRCTPTRGRTSATPATRCLRLTSPLRSVLRSRRRRDG